MPDVTRYWYQRRLHPYVIAMLPLSWLYQVVSSLRRACYRLGLKKQYFFNVPVIVVGNITVGGTGKTPMVIWLANMLRNAGYQPGIVSRGYGGEAQSSPRLVNITSSPRDVGDEPVLLAIRTGCPVVVAADRVAAVKTLLNEKSCDVIISDDGLQHYRLGRVIDIAIVDGMRGMGNRRLLPAGPLREPEQRLQQVDFVVTHGKAEQGNLSMTLLPDAAVSLSTRQTKLLAEFRHTKVHAVAAIGNPQRFFNTLIEAGLDIIPHAFPDHYQFKQTDLMFMDKYPVMMTEKDAVKCRGFEVETGWYLPVTAQLSDEFESSLLQLLKSRGVYDKHAKK